MARKPLFPEAPDFTNYPGQQATPFNLDSAESTWVAEGHAGEGAHGSVVHWIRKDDDGVLVDEMAIKTIAYDENEDLGGIEGLNEEAVLHSQLNTVGCENVAHLRGFKYFGEQRHSKFFLEYLHNGDLERLRLRYKAWNTYLPEVFLWHLFHSLAKAACAMDTRGIWFNMVKNQPYPHNQSMVHVDIKPPNILVGKESQATEDSTVKEISLMYPTIKLADFGLAQITGPGDKNNPRYFMDFGTDHFIPPEFIHDGVEWTKPPNGRPLLQTNGQPFRYRAAADLESKNKDPGFFAGPRHNIWGFGKVMHDMLTLSEFDDLHDSLSMYVVGRGKFTMDRSEEEYYDNGEHFCPEIVTLRTPEYSIRLRELVRDCLRTRISYRPSPQELLEATSKGLTTALAKAAATPDSHIETTERLFFRGNEINRMVAGTPKFEASETNWKSLTKGQDPLQTPLVPPRHWNSFREQDTINQDVQAESNVQLRNENRELRQTQLQLERDVDRYRARAVGLEASFGRGVGNSLNQGEARQAEQGGSVMQRAPKRASSARSSGSNEIRSTSDQGSNKATVGQGQTENVGAGDSDDPAPKRARTTLTAVEEENWANWGLEL